MLAAQLSYARARQIMRGPLTQLFTVDGILVDSVISEARRVNGDVYDLCDVVMMIQSCSIALGHLGYTSDLNAMHTLGSISRYPPSQLRRC